MHAEKIPSSKISLISIKSRVHRRRRLNRQYSIIFPWPCRFNELVSGGMFSNLPKTIIRAVRAAVYYIGVAIVERIHTISLK